MNSPMHNGHDLVVCLTHSGFEVNVCKLCGLRSGNFFHSCSKQWGKMFKGGDIYKEYIAFSKTLLDNNGQYANQQPFFRVTPLF